MEKNISKFKEQFINYYSDFENGLNGESTPELKSLRQKALETFNELPLPTTKDEEWRYTNISPLLKHNFSVPNKVTTVSKEQLSEYQFDKLKSHLLVFVNGNFSAERSILNNLPDGVIIGSLSGAVKNHPEIVEKHFGKYAGDERQVFTALSTAYTKDGAFVYVPDGKNVEETIHNLFLLFGCNENDMNCFFYNFSIRHINESTIFGVCST